MRKATKKIAVTMAAALMVSSVSLTGCGSSDSSDTSGSSQPASSEAASSGTSEASSEAAETDPVQNLIAATTDTVKLTVWASELDQDFTQGLLDSFKSKYSDVTFDITLGAESEADAKDDVLKDVEAAPDVYAFADDQINELVKGGALQEVANTYTYDVKGANVESSVEAATLDGKLYAYPMTADNGYFMYYDKSVFSESDVESLDQMLSVAKEKGKKIGMPVANGWYLYSFFKGAGLDVTLKDDGSNDCNWNAEGGTDVAQAIIDLGKSGCFVDLGDGDLQTGVKDGTLAACVSGVWDSETVEKEWKENYAATKLPSFTCGGELKQMGSFAGFKMIGVNPHSKFVGWSMILAEYLTNAENQLARFQARGLGPANAEAASSDEVQSSPAIAALAKQAGFAVPQRVGGNFWDPAATLGKTLIGGNQKGTDLQKLLDNTVEGITDPVNN
ncbi:MAG: extracellular solute-binding protein [Lachnospiraceae bacterium]|nr:extracellular solute-binding protein [Lachnospiraceae bacterium]